MLPQAAGAWPRRVLETLLHWLVRGLAISTKNKHLLVIYSIPTRGFTAVLSVFWGTPPAKPLECKFRLNASGALDCDRGADPIGGEPRLSRTVL